MVEIYQDDLSPLLNSFHEGIYWLNAQGELLYYNEMAQKHWDLAHQSIDKVTRQEPVARALAGEYVQHALVHLNNNYSLLVNTLPLHSDTHAVKGVVIISQDVSEQVLLEQQALSALQVLLEVLLGIHGTGETTEIDEVLRRIAALIPQLESVDNSIAFRVDETSRRLIPVALFGASQRSFKEWHAELSAIELNTEQALQKSSPPYLQSLRLARPLMVDFTVETTWHNPHNLRAAIYAPVVVDGHVVGLLGVERHRPLDNASAYFPQWSVDLLTALARLATISIEKMLLINSIERLEGDLTSARTLLSQRDEFLSLTAHELKNPLTAIRGQAQIFRRRLSKSLHTGIDGSEAPEATHELVRGLESIEHQSRRIEHMINTLLDVSRIDLDRFELELREIDLIQVARRALEEQHFAARNHELRFLVNGQPVPIVSDTATTAPSIKIQADEEQIEQVLTNLISNALKYSPEDGPVTVSLLQIDHNYVEIAVEDHGIGVSPEDQAHITERFYRAENAQNIDSKGLGLGLYLVSMVVAKHGGALSISSEGVPGKGSTFTITLPYHQL